MTTYDFEEKPKRKPVEYELADTGTRFFALIIDGIILVVITGILFAFGRGLAEAGSFIAGILYQWYFLTQQDGQTPGKRMMGIRVVRTNGEPIDLATVIIRSVGYYINSFALGIGWLWALFNDNRQGWHDLLASTYVVRA